MISSRALALRERCSDEAALVIQAAAIAVATSAVSSPRLRDAIGGNGGGLVESSPSILVSFEPRTRENFSFWAEQGE